jgi:hypothetical protein
VTAPAYNEELPTLKEELTRKSLEMLEEILLKHKRGKISMAQMDYALDVLFGTVNGLVDREFIELITMASTQVNKADPSYIERHVMRKEGGSAVLIVERRMDDDTLKIHRMRLNGLVEEIVKKYADSTIPSEQAKAGVEFTIASTKKIGYEEVL